MLMEAVEMENFADEVLAWTPGASFAEAGKAHGAHKATAKGSAKYLDGTFGT